jgi:hypothetical protein
VADRGDFLAHRALVGDDPARPSEDAIPLRGQALETRSAIHKEHAHLLFECLDAGRKRRLRHAAGFRGTAEVPLARKGHEKLELGNQMRGLGRRDLAITLSLAIEKSNRSRSIGVVEASNPLLS